MITLITLFTNPAFLFIAGALVSVPIIIHLINRMRFKRIRWAAMEFLLKAQKRTRRRLIIEQLILLMLRCMLIALVGLLVSRFIGCGDANLGGKPSLHIVLLDDTLSMKDGWKQEGEARNCFDIAKTGIKTIAKGLSKSKTTDHLVILPLSKINDPSFEVKAYTGLNNKERFDKLTSDITEMQPSFLHVDMKQAVKKAQEIMGNYGNSIVTLHVIGDFRAKDWARPAGEGLTNDLVNLVKDKKGEVKLFIIDTVHPQRAGAQSSYPPARDNIGIVNVRPSTRITGKNTPVNFEVSIQNYSGKDADCFVAVYDGTTGKRIAEARPNPPNPVRVKADGTTKVNFEHRFNPDPKSVSAPFEHISVRLATPALAALPNDGLLDDNVRHAMIEVRDKIPILVIDGEGGEGLKENKDSFHIYNALMAVEGRSFKIDFGHEIASGKPALALEKVDLRKYATIYLLNVPDFTPKQVKALESYVNDGGGVAFFLGPLVTNLQPYNKELYKQGKGIFPAPLKELYPARELPALEKKSGDSYDLLIRDDKFGSMDQVPIFGEFLKEPSHRMPLQDLPIRRYFKVDRNAWSSRKKAREVVATITGKGLELGQPWVELQIEGEEKANRYKLEGPLARLDIARLAIGSRHSWVLLDDGISGMDAPTTGKQMADPIFELATLPNELPASRFGTPLAEITRGDNMKAIRADRELAKYRPRLEGHLAKIEELAHEGSDAKSYQLAQAIEVLFNDRGDDKLKDSMTEFWIKADSNIERVRTDLKNLREQVQYGDAFVVARKFGKGKVVAVMSTAGKDWNDFGGGSLASIIYQPFIWEMNNYLSNSAGESNPTVGTDVDLVVDAEQYKGMQLSLVRYFLKTDDEKPQQRGEPIKLSGRVDGNQVVFNLRRHYTPGLWVSELVDDAAPGKAPLATFGHVFNVDTENEGRLQRVSSDDLKNDLLNKADKDVIKVVGPTATDDALVGKTDDFSESPWLFLMFLFVLVAEQALAVHLSFHLKTDDQELQPAGLRG